MRCMTIQPVNQFTVLQRLDMLRPRIMATTERAETPAERKHAEKLVGDFNYDLAAAEQLHLPVGSVLPTVMPLSFPPQIMA